MSNIVVKTKKHIQNFPGKNLGKKYIVFESDDWGSERIPSKVSMKYLITNGIDPYSNPFNHLDSLESADDLSALFDTLTKFKDIKGNHPVITANSVMANPDYGKIKDSDFRDYHFETVLETYKNKKGCENSYAVMRDGIASGVYHPQFHGREHLNVNQWLKALQSGNDILVKAFRASIYGIDLQTDMTNRANFMAAFDGNSSSEISSYGDIIKEGTTLFSSMYGFSSQSFIAPCYVWHPSLEVFLKENGIKYLQGLPVQLAPDFKGGYRKIYHYQGEKNRIRQIYFTRNCFFEPSLNPEFNFIDDCIQRMKIIFFWGKPAIIGTHRINFIGSLNEENRRKNLEQFSILLSTILKTWPDVEFITTDKLGEIYQNTNQ